jgi:hypothetical protein
VLNADENNVVVETVAAVDGDDHFLLHCYWLVCHIPHVGV